MNENWEYSAVTITKYNPAYRDANGHYTKDEWIGFSQIEEPFEDGVLTFESYRKEEEKYIQAAILFFEFHGCNKIVLKSVEKGDLKNDFSEYRYEDREELIDLYDKISDGCLLFAEETGTLVKLILRDFVWAELFCSDTDDIAVRFGYDFYMTFNSNRNMDELFGRIRELGLYIGT